MNYAVRKMNGKYEVYNITTKAVVSSWKSLIDARRVASDLNARG